jgi:ketosteroid isomerase-like protein
MKTSTACAAVAAFLLAGCASTRPAPTPPSGAVLAEIKGALQRWNDEAGRGDLPAFMSQFDDSPDILLVGSDKGEVFKGRAQIEGWLSKLMAKNRFSWQMDRVDISASDDAAWVFVDGAMVVKNAAGKVLVTRAYRFTGVLVKRGDGWAWRLFHGSIPGGE